MTPRCKFRRINAGWIRAEMTAPSAELQNAIVAFAELPGVTVNVEDEWAGCSVEFPNNVLRTEAYWAVREQIDACYDVVPAFLDAMPPRAREHDLRGLYPHQVAAVEFLCSQNGGGALLCDEMGLGKTRSAAVAAHVQTPPGGHVLITGPTYVRDVWRNELRALGYVQDDADFWAVEGLRDDSATWQRARRARWWFCHYEVMSVWATRFYTNPAGRPSVAIVDEGHWVRNARAARTKHTVACMTTISRRILLTGTPLANRPRELWSLLTMATGASTWGSEYDFRVRYCGAASNGYGLEDRGPTNVEELQARLSTCYLRRTKDDAGLRLPPITRRTVDVRGQVPASELDLERLRSITTALQRGSYGLDTLRMMGELARETSRVKLDTTIEFVRSLADQGEAAVVFCTERRVATAIAKACRGNYVHGELKLDMREALVQQFQSGEFSVLTATYGALREGVTLHRAHHVVLHDLSWVPADVLQAEARVYRIGQKSPVSSWWMVLEKSFDTLLAAHLVSKGRVIAEALGDVSPEQAFASSGLQGFDSVSFEDEVQKFLSNLRSAP